MKDFEFCFDMIVRDSTQQSDQRSQAMRHLKKLLDNEIARVLQAIDLHGDDMFDMLPGGDILKVHVSDASQLEVPNGCGNARYSCTCEIDGKRQSVATTSAVTISSSARPEWDQEFVISGYAPSDTLIFSIFVHRDSLSNATLLGKAELMSSRFAANAFDGGLVLEDAEGNIAAFESPS